jgi:ABC-type transport system involved in multi-copper enzyme maturation permease subunit
MRRYRYTPNELHARMVVTVGVLLAIVFSLIVLGMIYGLLFISQPLEQSPNDAAFIDLMSTIVVFLTGTLSGLVASNGIKNKNTSPDDLDD